MPKESQKKNVSRALPNASDEPTIVYAGRQRARTSVICQRHVQSTKKQLANVPSVVREKLHEAFELVDRDGDGRISADDIRYDLCKRGGVGKVTKESTQDMVAAADHRREGSLTIDEFLAMVVECFPVNATNMELLKQTPAGEIPYWKNWLHKFQGHAGEVMVSGDDVPEQPPACGIFQNMCCMPSG